MGRRTAKSAREVERAGRTHGVEGRWTGKHRSDGKRTLGIQAGRSVLRKVQESLLVAWSLVRSHGAPSRRGIRRGRAIPVASRWRAVRHPGPRVVERSIRSIHVERETPSLLLSSSPAPPRGSSAMHRRLPPPSPIDPSIWTVRFHPDPSPGTSPPSIPDRRRPRPSHRYLSHSNRYLGPCPCDRLRISGVGGMRHEMAPFERRQRRSPCRWRLPAAPLRTCARLGGDRARIVSPGRRPDGFEASQEARTDPRNRSTSPTWWQLPTAGNCARHRRETP